MARPTVDQAAAGVYSASLTPGTADFAMGGVMETGSDPQDPPDDVEWGGATMTSQQVSAAELFGRGGRLASTTSPGTGSKSISTSDSGTMRSHVGITLDGTDSGNEVDSTGKANGTGTSIAIPLSPTADQLVVAFIYCTSNPTSFTAGTDTTVQDDSPVDSHGCAIVTSTGDINVTLGSSTDWQVLYAIINGPAAAGSDFPFRRFYQAGII